jgi:hypothetical protein
MTKEQIARLIDLETTDDLKVSEAIELGRLRQQFETWEPVPVTLGPVSTGTFSPKCNCNEPWFGIQPRWCPVHRLVGQMRVTCHG